MKSQEIRENFLNFYKERGHAIIPSSSLIPENDPTLLFVNSGMFPLVPYLLGGDHPEGKRLTNYQCSFRSDDIEEVGDGRHTTLFEMLGNWSLGDYFKKEQLNWWFEFLIEVIKLDINKIYQTVYLGDNKIQKDNESILILKDIYKKYGISAEEGPETKGKGALGPGININFQKEKIFAYGNDKNWWQRGDAVGELGGPDSETFYDTGIEHDLKFGPHCHPNCDCGRFLEIGNSVFMQYQKTENHWKEIKNKNVDFGGGLERIVAVASGFSNIFEIDLLKPLILEIEKISKTDYEKNRKSFEIIADHAKSITFIIGDTRGVVPSNKHQGYFVRRLIRRALVYGKQINIDSDYWLKNICTEVVNIYDKFYPELRQNLSLIIEEIEKEETKFKKTLRKGLLLFDKFKDQPILSGKIVFDLFQTYGFPIELTKELAAKGNQQINEKELSSEIKKHQELSKTASAGVFKSGLADSQEKTIKFHTATHLLLASLRKVLKEDIIQKGSNITSERIRFDFNFPRKVSDEEIKEIEDLINKKIQEDLIVKKEEMSLKDAIDLGAQATFGEKYPERVTVFSLIDNLGNVFSREICSGPHVEKTSEIGQLKITKEESVGAGIRRIKAIII